MIVKQRPAESHVGGWSIPGGAVEKGETVEQGAVREAREEAGVDVELFGPTTLVRTAITAPSESSLEYALAIFSARVSGGVITPIDTKEIAKVRVASFHQIDLLIERGQFPSLHPKIDRAVIEFFGRIAAS